MSLAVQRVLVDSHGLLLVLSDGAEVRLEPWVILTVLGRLNGVHWDLAKSGEAEPS